MRLFGFPKILGFVQDSPAVAPTLPVVKSLDDNAREILLEAANLIKEKGWTKRRLQDKDGSFCTVGAIYAATYKLGLWSSRGVPPVTIKALNRVKQFLNVGYVEGWNDDIIYFGSLRARRALKAAARL